jgi:hypothetical protein
MKRLVTASILIILISVLLTGCGFIVPRPEIKTGEFNFSITYEMDGEVKNYTGVYVCRYKGVNWTLDGGYHRDWEGWVKDDEEEKTLIIGTTDDGGVIHLIHHFYPEYFMGDAEGDDLGDPVPYVAVYFEDGEGLHILTDVNEIEELYGVRIISYVYDSPIQNSFSILN